MKNERLKKVWAVIGKRKLIFVIVALFIISVILDPSYVRKFNMNSLLVDISIIGLLAFGEMLAILSGGIDLSVGCIASAASVFAAYSMILLEPHVPPAVNLILSLLIAILACTLLGLFNGFSIAILGLPPLIATLGGEWIAKGLGYYCLNGLATPFKVKELAYLSRKGIGPFPFCLFLLFIVGALVYHVLTKRKAGRAVYAVGGNKYSARISGINVRRTIILVYAASATLAAIGGIALGAYTGTGYVKGANNYELYAIASVAIGGVSMAGGSGDSWNALCGVFIFRMLKKVMVYANLSDQLEGLYLGLLLLVALFISTNSISRFRSNKPKAAKKAADAG